MKTRKSISYAYPTSQRAEAFGKANGCWYIQQTVIREDGSIGTSIHPQANSEAFDAPNDIDLIALFREVDGTPEQCFLAYGNPLALKALGLST